MEWTGLHRRGIGSPRTGKIWFVQVSNVGLVEVDSNENIFIEYCRGVQMDQDLKHRE
jgi:hypothetical protein